MHLPYWDKYALIWSEVGRPKAGWLPAGFLEEYPDPIHVCGRTYRHLTGWRNDDIYFWGAIVGQDRRLVGFDIHIIDESLASMARATWPHAVWYGPGYLYLMLTETESCDVEGTEGFPIDFYCDEEGGLLVCLNLSAFRRGPLAFPLIDID